MRDPEMFIVYVVLLMFSPMILVIIAGVAYNIIRALVWTIRKCLSLTSLIQ